MHVTLYQECGYGRRTARGESALLYSNWDIYLIKVHVSGAGNFFDGGVTDRFDEGVRVGNDYNQDDIRQINPQMFNGAVDKLILDAGERAKILTHVVCPSLRGLRPAIGPGVPARRRLHHLHREREAARLRAVHLADLTPFLQEITIHAARAASTTTASAPDTALSAYARYYIASAIASADPPVSWRALTSTLAHAMDYRYEARGVRSVAEAGVGAVLGANMLSTRRPRGADGFTGGLGEGGFGTDGGRFGGGCGLRGFML
ncbi:Uu.00g142110.m01.CDS01 [Anthostomella pinea]|uniref:Uu.00g142110.m01.CDS01 n=1 Tax=Anthostomella pinea TaxID=933095 RepID=A0AAI8YLN8_9PEZI|nr:Uu.00g142110.m01.CDS01 [Anthostomella pinea]